MKCRLIRNKAGKIEKALAPNGKESILYNSIKNSLPDSIEFDNYLQSMYDSGKMQDTTKEEIAAALWQKTYAPQFKIWYSNLPLDKNKEPLYTDKVRDLYNKGEFIIEDSINDAITNDEIEKAHPQLEEKLTEILNSLDVDVKEINSISNRNGEAISVFGRANLYKGIVELSKGRNITTLPEEAAHMFTHLIGREHPLMRQMMSNVVNYKVYEDLKNHSEYSKLPEEKLRFEAVGKVIAQHLIKEYNLPEAKRNLLFDWFKRALRYITKKLSDKDNSKVFEEIDAFAKTARLMLNHKKRLRSNLANKSKRNRNLASIGESFNMNSEGFMPETINESELKSILSKRGFKDVTVKRASTGSYYFFRNNRKINPFEVAHQFGSSQAEIVQFLQRDDAKFAPFKRLDDKGRERYVFDNDIVANRVTDKQSELFEKGKTKAQLEKIRNKPKSKIGAEFGTIAHDILDNLLKADVENSKLINNVAGTRIDRSFDSKGYLNQQQLNTMATSVETLTDEIEATQEEINRQSGDPNGRAIVITESKVIDKNKDIAGSQDVLVVYSDGSVSIYDYKFINFEKEKIGKVWKVNPEQEISPIKEKAFNLQLSEYKRILRDVYGVTKFRNTRILPFNVQYKYNKLTKQLENKVHQLEGFDPESDKQYLIPLPVVNEMTEDKQLNKILKTLFERDMELDDELRANWRSPIIAESLRLEKSAVKKAIKYIQVKSDLSPLVESINLTLHNVSNLRKDLNEENIGDLNKAIAEINLFHALFKIARPAIKNTSEEELDKISGKLDSAKIVLSEKLVDFLTEYDPDIDSEQKELKYLKANTGYFSQMNQPIFQLAWQKIKKATGDTNRDIQAFAEELETEVNLLKSWAKSNGMSLLDAYRKITNPNTKNLIGKFSSTFWEQRQQAQDNADFGWFKANYEYTKEGKQRYEENLKSYEAHLQRTVGEGKMYEIRLDIWKNKNDLSRDSAWLNSWAVYNYSELRKEDRFYSNEYKDLQQPKNKGLKRYYDFYVKANQDFNALHGIEEEIGSTFVANIQKDFVDELAQGGGLLTAFKGMKDSFINGMRVRQNDRYQYVGDSKTKIPLLYYDNFMYKDKDGEWKSGSDRKNEDLTNNLLLFAESVYRKHHMSKIKDLVESLKLQINNQEVIVVGNDGKIKRNEVTGETETKQSDVNAKVFTSLTNALVYGKRLQNSDYHVTVGDHQYSMNKILSNVMSYMSTKSLAFNYVSGFGNLTAGYLNAYIKGVGGKYYTRNQMWDSHKLMMSRGNNDLFNHLKEFWNVERDHWVRENAAKLSLSTLTKNLTYDKFYLLQQKGDEFIANTVLMAMMKNYGIAENGEVKRLALLPEGTKSLMDRVVRKDDKISIDGLDNKGFDEFRNMVKYVSRQIKGTNTSEDISMIQTTIWGKSLMHFRNWIAPMVKERFGSLEYTADVKEFEYGRYKSLWFSIAKDKLAPSLMKLATDIATFGLMKYKGDVGVFQKQYYEFLENNPELRGKLTLPEYVELRQRTIRETIHEIRIITGMLIVMAAMKGDWDDDGKADYKQSRVGRFGYKLLNRAYLELSFFTNPTSVKDLLKSPVPIMQVGVDLANLVNNSWDEFGDWLFPEISKDEWDPTGVGHYTKKLIPIAKYGFEFLEDFNGE